jgi:hypothetical protein
MMEELLAVQGAGQKPLDTRGADQDFPVPVSPATNGDQDHPG